MVGSVVHLRLQAIAYAACIFTMGDGTAPVQRQAEQGAGLPTGFMEIQPVRHAQN